MYEVEVDIFFFFFLLREKIKKVSNGCLWVMEIQYFFPLYHFSAVSSTCNITEMILKNLILKFKWGNEQG